MGGLESSSLPGHTKIKADETSPGFCGVWRETAEEPKPAFVLDGNLARAWLMAAVLVDSLYRDGFCLIRLLGAMFM